jgi:hypothetical protein
MPGEVSGDLLASVLVRTLEESAFVFLEPADEHWDPGAGSIEATLEYSAEHRAELRLATSEAFAATVAANMLGEEEGGADLTGDDEDAIGELLNMMAGWIAAELFGRHARCTLGIPRVRRIGIGEQLEAAAAAGTIVTMADEEGRRIQLSSRWIGAAPCPASSSSTTRRSSGRS